MKKFSTVVGVLVLMTSLTYAQPTPTTSPEGFTGGEVILPTNTTLAGPVKDNIRKKGEVTLITDGKKTRYKAGDINGVKIGNTQFIAQNYTFYEVLWQGKQISLLRKASEPAGVQSNGSDAVVISSEGDIDDLFVKKDGEPSLKLLTKKNIKEVLTGICGNCAAGVDPAKFDAESVKKALSGL